MQGAALPTAGAQVNKSDDDGKQRRQGRCKTDGKQAFRRDPGYHKGDGNANEKGRGEVVGHGKDGASAAVEKAVQAKHKAYQDKVKAEGTQVFRAAGDNGCIAGKNTCKKGGPDLYQHKAGNAKTQRQEDGVLHTLFGAVLLAGAHILRNHRGQGGGKSSGRQHRKGIDLTDNAQRSGGNDAHMGDNGGDKQKRDIYQRILKGHGQPQTKQGRHLLPV